MSKKILLTDTTALYDKKVFLLVLDGVAGITQTQVVRSYLGVDDTALPLTNPDGTELSNRAFEGGDATIIQYNASTPGYEVLNLRASVSGKSRIVTNGFTQAGYIVDSNGDVSDNTENFEIPSGIRAGYGGAGSSGVIYLKDGVSLGDNSFNILNRRVSASGIPYNVLEITPGFDSAYTEAVTIGTGAKDFNFSFDVSYSNQRKLTFFEELVVPFADLVFNGEDSVFDQVPTGFVEGDTYSFVFANYDSSNPPFFSDDRVSELTAVVVDHNGVLKSVVRKRNIASIFTGYTEYRVGVIPEVGKNSITIGNNTDLANDNEVVIGSRATQSIDTTPTGLISTSLTFSSLVGINTQQMSEMGGLHVVQPNVTLLFGPVFSVTGDTLLTGDLTITGSVSNPFKGIVATSVINHTFTLASTAYVMTFDTVTEAGDMTHSVSPFSEFTCVTPGLYKLEGMVAAETGSGTCEVWFEKHDGTAYSTILNTVSQYESATFDNKSSGVVSLVVGDKIRLRAALGIAGMTQAVDPSLTGNTLLTSKIHIERIAE